MAKVGGTDKTVEAQAAASANNAKKTEKAKETEELFVENKTNNTNKATTAELKKQQENQKAANAAAKTRAQEAKAAAKKDNTGTKIKVKGNQITKTYKNGKTVVETVDKNGTVTKKTTTTGKGSDKVTTTVNYDGKGQKTSAKTVKGQGENKTTTVTKYENNKKTEKTTTGKVNGETSTVKYEYGENGKAATKTITKGTGENKEQKVTNYSYNDNGTIASKSTTDELGTVRTINYSGYKTNDDGSTTRTATVTTTDADGRISAFTENQTLDKNNKLTSTERFNSDGVKIKTSNYEYDDNGNRVSGSVSKYGTDGTQKTINYSNYKTTSNGTTYDREIIQSTTSGDIKKTTDTRTKYFDSTYKTTQKGEKTVFSNALNYIKEKAKDASNKIKEIFNGLSEAEETELEKYSEMYAENNGNENKDTTSTAVKDMIEDIKARLDVTVTAYTAGGNLTADDKEQIKKAVLEEYPNATFKENDKGELVIHSIDGEVNRAKKYLNYLAENDGTGRISLGNELTNDEKNKIKKAIIKDYPNATFNTDSQGDFEVYLGTDAKTVNAEIKASAKTKSDEIIKTEVDYLTAAIMQSSLFADESVTTPVLDWTDDDINKLEQLVLQQFPNTQFTLTDDGYLICNNSKKQN